MANVMRFMLLADDRAGSAFNRFADKVDKANGSMDRNQAALKRQAQASKSAQNGLLTLTGTVTGFGDASRAASSKAGMLARVMGGVGLATGLAEPLMAGLLVTTGALAGALVTAGAGAGAFMVALKPSLTVVSALMKAQATSVKAGQMAQLNYQKALAAGVAPATALAAKQATLAASQRQLTAANKLASPAQRQLAGELVKAKDAYKAWGQALSGPVLAPLSMAVKFIQPALKAIAPLARAAAGAFKTLVGELGANIAAGGLTRIVATLLPHVVPTILNLAHAIGNITAGIWGVIKAFLPMSDTITGGVARLTARFKEWGLSLPSHSGFQSLMAMFKGQVPGVTALFKNLVIIVKQIATAITGLSTPANSKALIQILTPLSQIMVKLTANQGLVRSVLYFMLMKSALSQLKPAFTGAKLGIDAITGSATGIQKTYGAFQNLRAGFTSVTAAGLPMTGMAGTLGGKLKIVADKASEAGTALAGKISAGANAAAKGLAAAGTAVAGVVSSLAASSWAWVKNTAVMVGQKAVQLAVAAGTKLMAAAQWLLNVAMDANPIGLVVLALVALGAAFYLAWTHSATFRKILTKAWNAVWDVAKIVIAWFAGPFVNFFTKTIPHVFGLVLSWVKANWPLLLGILTGPIGLAVLWITKHWGAITKFMSDSWHTMTKAVRDAFAWMVDQVLGFFGTILHGAATMLGWVPNVGAKLKTAAAAFDTFRQNVNASLRGVNGHTVTVGVNFNSQALGLGINPGPPKFKAAGGLIRGPGTGTSDTAGLYWLSNKEYVQQAAAVAHYGTAFMDAVNARRLPKMARGGIPGGGIDVRTSLPTSVVIDRAIGTTISALASAFAKGVLGAGGPMIAYARQFVGRVPYVWGGTTPAGWDCSGFTSWVYHHFGIGTCPRTSQQQQLWAAPSMDRPGALAFFYGTGGTAQHVGLSMGNGKMINAYGTGFGTIISPSHMAGFSGFGVPPGGLRKFGRGGLITEPIIGLGLRTGRGVMLGEAGIERVTPGAGAARPAGPLISFGGDLVVREEADIAVLGQKLGFAIRSASF